MSLAAQQAGFAAYLLGESDTPPPGLHAPERAQIYRNNVRLSLTAALAANFPVTAKLVGEEYFAQVARHFLRAYPPSQPDMARYGADFPAFLGTAPGMADFPYVPEVARVERAMIEALLAPAAPPLAASDFAAVPEASFADLRFSAHPSTRLIQSAFAVADLWQAHQATNTPDLSGMALDRPQSLVLTRPDVRVEWQVLAPDDARFLSALLAGASIAEAVADEPEGFDLTDALLGLLRASVFTRLQS
jgi:hypothetical protein